MLRVRGRRSVFGRGVVWMVAVVCCGVAGAPRAAAQCGGWDSSLGMTPNVVPRSAIVWDADGPGPSPPRIVAHEGFTRVGVEQVSEWDGLRWRPTGLLIPDGLSIPSLFALWDPDGQGPLGPVVVLGRNDTIRSWDGRSWTLIPSAADGRITAVEPWDPDGAGPERELLVVSGTFTRIGGVGTRRIAAWDGVSWRALSSGLSSQFGAGLTTWDPDGPGPEGPSLVAFGQFTEAGGVAVDNVARWDGSSWHRVGPALEGSVPGVSAATSWDPDGPGPRGPLLVVAGRFTGSQGVALNNIAAWDGSAWMLLGGGITIGGLDSIDSLTSWDPDGVGGANPVLLVGGRFREAGGIAVSNIASWDGSSWSAIEGWAADARILRLQAFDPGRSGPGSEEVLVRGDLSRNTGDRISGLAVLSGRGWRRALPSGWVSSTVRAAVSWNAGGGPGGPSELVVGGSFRSADNAITNVARTTGGAWQPMGRGVNGAVRALAAWDGGSGGPGSATIIAGGSFTEADRAPASRIAAWDGRAWSPLGAGMDSDVFALETWDPDGPGPQPSLLVAGGAFSSAGGVPANRVAAWDGAAWRPLGDGFEGAQSRISALASWDPDGPGPEGVLLVAGGVFGVGGGPDGPRVAVWDGTRWRVLGSQIGSEMLAPPDDIEVWDPDGPGPRTPTLVVGGPMSYDPAPTSTHIWTGSAWERLGTTSGPVDALIQWDLDGPGPLPVQLVAGGSLLGPTPEFGVPLVRWDGAAWRTFGTRITAGEAVVRGLTGWDDGSGTDGRLVMTGSFSEVDGLIIEDVAVWDTRGPRLALAPRDQTVAVGRHASLEVRADSVTPAGVRWRKDGVELADGPTPHGSRIIGSGSERLVIGGVGAEDAGVYDAVLTSACGSTVSPAARLSVVPECPGSGPCGPADWTGDGGVDFNDLLAFLDEYNAASDCADISRDGGVDSNDFLTFLERFNGPGC